MSASNTTLLIGNLGQKPIARKVGEQTVVSFDIAVTRPMKDKNTGEYLSDWFTCEAWAGLADYIADNLDKGHRVSVSGWTKIDKWEKDGVKRERAIICVDSLMRL